MTADAALAVQLEPLKLRNPIVTASGTFGYGLEFTDFVDLSLLGGICTKGLSLKPHAGNVPPRICETPAGMLNAIGLQNVGVDIFPREKLPRLTGLDATVLANSWGADVLSLVNTFVGMAIDPETGRPLLSFGTGGLSGPAIKPLAVRMVFQVARALPGVPIMGIGGISQLSDVLEFLAAGATAVQVGTANFNEPGVSARLVAGVAG